MIFDALNALDVHNVLASVLINVPAPADPVYQVAYGSSGGEAILEGRLQSNGTGWLTIQSENYKEGSLEDNGLVIFEITSYDASNLKYDATVGYSDMEFKGPGRDLIVNGTSVMTGVNIINLFGTNLIGVDSMNTTATIQDNLSGNTLYLDNFSLSYDQGVGVPGSFFGNISGNVYESNLGYFSLTSPGTPELAMNSTSSIGFYSGALTITGSNNTSVAFNSLNPYFAYIGLDLTGSGSIQQVARFDLTNSQIDTTTDPLGRQNPVASIDQPASTTLDQPTTLNAYYSHSPKGAFLTCQWNMKLVPPGSAIPTGITAGPMLSFTPDMPGDYLAVLTVSDGSQTATDAYVLHVNPPGRPPNS
ncbi:MAG: hypothetical protein KGL13_03805, partial [Gammaproteobacteria bacterium]|nr:hypothetical protein [Gammaproteobacteria bacterium]